MSKELDEKREDLKGLIESKRQLETTLQQNKKGLSDALPYDLAVDLYKTGRMSENDFLAYKNGYEALETSIQMTPATIAVLEEEIEKLKAEIKNLEQQEREERRKESGGDEKTQIAIGKAVLCVFGTIAGYILFSISYKMLNYILELISQIPFLRVILYWPSDASWAKIVLPPMASVAFGAWVCVKICGGAKLFSSLIVLLYSASMIIWFVTYGFSIQILFTCVMFILTACITFHLKRSDT